MMGDDQRADHLAAGPDGDVQATRGFGPYLLLAQ